MNEKIEKKLNIRKFDQFSLFSAPLFSLESSKKNIINIIICDCDHLNILHYLVQSHTIPYNTIQYLENPKHFIFNTIQYKLQYNTIQYNTIQYLENPKLFIFSVAIMMSSVWSTARWKVSSVSKLPEKVMQRKLTFYGYFTGKARGIILYEGSREKFCLDITRSIPQDGGR